jgi:chromosome segregation ATPase
MSLSMTGCKAQQQMQQQIAEMDNRVKDIERRSRDLESELKKSNMELMQLRGVVKQVGDATVQLQKLEEDRQKNAAEAKSKAEAAKEETEEIQERSAYILGLERRCDVLQDMVYRFEEQTAQLVHDNYFFTRQDIQQRRRIEKLEEISQATTDKESLIRRIDDLASTITNSIGPIREEAKNLQLVPLINQLEAEDVPEFRKLVEKAKAKIRGKK